MFSREKRYPLGTPGIVFTVVLSLLFITNIAFAAKDPGPTKPGKDNKAILEKAFKIQMPFIANEGQIADEHVRFYAKTFGGTVFVTDQGEMVYSFSVTESKPSQSMMNPRDRHQKSEDVKVWILREKLIGSLDTVPKALDKAETKVNYFIGNDKSKWKTSVTTHNEVSLGEIYEGIDLHLKAYGKNVEKIFTVKPGVEVNTIKLKMEGANSLKINNKGELEIGTGLEIAIYSKPVAYQEINGKRRDIKVAYLVERSTPDTHHSSLVYGFKVGDYDKSFPLIIDPMLKYSSRIGGSGGDGAQAIAADLSGNVYITGYTFSTDFPATPGAYWTTNKGLSDVFVVMINAAGTALVYATYLGGSDLENGMGIAVDGSGNAYIAGLTASTDFPTTPGAYRTAYQGGIRDAFVTKINPTGTALVYSTYLGGSDLDQAYGIAVDSSGNAYITGDTASGDAFDSISFPTTPGAFQASCADAVSCSSAYMTKINSTGTGLAYSTYLGGNWDEVGRGIAVDSSGKAYITGETKSTDFPITTGAYQTSFGGGDSDAFVAKMNPAGSGPNDLVYSTYLGGTGRDGGVAIAVDSSGNAYVTGYTYSSTDFPITTGAYQTSFGGGVYDTFVAKINPAGSGPNDLVYSTYLGGNDKDFARGIAVDSSGNAYITGNTFSTDFPTTPGAYRTTFLGGGDSDAFVTKINPAGSSGNDLLYSTYLGGNGSDAGNSIAVDISGNAYVAGGTSSTDFPTVNPIPGASPLGYGGAFVAKFSGNLIDHTKWANLEFIRRIEGGAFIGSLHSAVRSYGNVLSNNLSLPSPPPSPVNSMQAMVTVNAIGSNKAYAHARIGGFFFHDPTAGGTFTGGDVYADIGIAEDYVTGRGLVAVGRTFRCHDAPDCLQIDHHHYFVLGEVNIGEPHTLRIEFNALNNFLFTFDSNPPTLDYNGIPSGVLTYEWKGIGTHIGRLSPVPLGPGEGGYVDAKFENVVINDIAFALSDANGMIDRTIWTPLEFVREQRTDGVYGLAVRSAGSFLNSYMDLIGGQNFNELQADLTVEQLINNPDPNPATPMAALEGSYYNVGGGNPGTDATGDIRALAGIRLNGTQPVYFYNIVKCKQPTCNVYPTDYDRLYYHQDAIGPDLVGKPHRLSIRHDDISNTFTFGFDGSLTTPGPSDPGWYLPLPPNSGLPPNVVKMGPIARVAFFSGPSGEGYVSARVANIATVADMDLDGVPDSVDNCPSVYNSDQKDTDGDGVGDVCDNCPTVANSNQADLSGSGMGDACRGTSKVTLPDTIPPAQAGAPLWVESCFYNGTGAPIVTFTPDCYNVFYSLRDSSGNPLPPTCRMPAAYGIPDDLITIETGGKFCVNCDVSEMYPPEVLIPGNYNVVATFSNYIQDPDLGKPTCYDPSGPPVPGGVPCYNLWRGAIHSTPGTLTIQGQAGQKKTAQITFDPSQWSVQWATVDGPPISAHISNIPTCEPPPSTCTDEDENTIPGCTVCFDVNNISPSTIRLNGTVPITGSSSTQGGVLTVQFDSSLAVKSLGSVFPGTAYPTVQGGFTSNSDIFSGKAPVTITGYYSFSGFFPPVDNPPVVNTAKGGQTVPVKWHITDSDGVPISNPDSFSSLTSYTVDCGSLAGEPQDAVDVATSGSSGLQNLGNGYWQYNWKTPKTAGCKVMVLTLADGDQFTAIFKFK